MKAVVVEINKKDAIVLSKKGDFIKIRNSGYYEVGHEIEVPGKPVFNISAYGKLASVAAACLLVVSLGLGAYAYSIPYSYVNIDINPSVEITANTFDRIIDVKALNEDGEKLLIAGGLKHRNVVQGVKELLKQATEQGYVNRESENAVMLAISGKSVRRAEALKDRVEKGAVDELGQLEAEAEIVIERVTQQRREQAGKEGVSPGKMLLIERLMDVDPEVDLDKAKSESVKSIMQNIKAYKKSEKANGDDKENGNGDDKADDKGNGKNYDNTPGSSAAGPANGNSSNAGSPNADSPNAGSPNAGSSNAGSPNAGSSNAGSSKAGSSNNGNKASGGNGDTAAEADETTGKPDKDDGNSAEEQDAVSTDKDKGNSSNGNGNAGQSAPISQGNLKDTGRHEPIASQTTIQKISTEQNSEQSSNGSKDADAAADKVSSRLTGKVSGKKSGR